MVLVLVGRRGLSRIAVLALAACIGWRFAPRDAPHDSLSARGPAARDTPVVAAPTGPLQPADFIVAGISDEADSAGIVAAIGRPDSVELRAHPWDTAGLRVWHYRRLAIDVALTESVEQITITGPATATARGVRVGDPVARVRAAYGERHGGDANTWPYDDEEDPSGLHGIEFRVRGDRVTGILLGYTGYDNAPPPWEWARPPWIVSGEGLGPITRRTSERDLIRLLGRENVTADSIYLEYEEEGIGDIATILFSGDSLRWVDIRWTDWPKSRSTPREISVGPAWRTREGIGLGTPLATLEALNGRPFTLSGWFTDYGGQVCSWEGGRLEESLRGVYVSLDYTGDWGNISEADQRELAGEDCRSSSLRSMRRLAPVVVEMRVVFRP
ncbi:MAG: hypothetical protein HY561_03940 [Gemmatimonadetes bacterium]|nr:hypothetical protein [Gemmatimonadota bacterium]